MGSKIIIISHEFSPYRGGIATYVEEIARAAVELGHLPEVWTQGSGDDAHLPFSVRRFCGKGTLRPESLLPLMATMYARSEELKQARVYLPSRASQWVYMNLYRLMGWNPGKEIITTFHGTEILRYATNSWLRKTSDLFFKNSVHRITTASEYSVALLKEKGFESWTKNIRVAPCALKSGFISHNASASDFRPTVDGKVRILTLARIHPRKGQKEFATALGQLPEGLRSKVIYQVAGKGDADYTREIVSQCQSSGVMIEILGEVSEEKIGEVYQNCDLYAMTSRSLPDSVEGFGMTYLEAGYFKKPVIGYHTGGVGEAVIHGKTGFLVPEGDVNGLAAFVQKLLESPELRRQMGEVGHQHAVSFSWKKTAKILFD